MGLARIQRAAPKTRPLSETGKPKSHFGLEVFRFLNELARNNNREWFLANKHRYESQVRDPFLDFIADFGPRLRKISSKFIADPRPVGGSMFRIYRDVRFSRDKSPYKTHIAAHFAHVVGRNIHAPVFYLHLSPGEVLAACGLWHPDPPTLAKVRSAIVAHPEKWKRAISDPKFRSVYELDGEKTVRAPKGYDPEHPMIEDLKRKDFTAVAYFNERDVLSSRFIDQYERVCAAGTPLMRFLTAAIGLPF